MKEPQIIRVKTKEMTVSSIEQFYIEVQEKNKFDVLTRLLIFNHQNYQLSLVVQNDEWMNLSEALNLRGYTCRRNSWRFKPSKTDV